MAFSVWADAAENPWSSTLGRTVVALGYMEPPEADTPGPFRLGDADRVRGLVESAGFASPIVDDVPLTWRNASFDEYWQITEDLSFTLATSLAKLGEAERALLRSRVEEALSVYAAEDGALTMPGLTRNVLARKAGSPPAG